MGETKPTVLFVCTGNAARSVMAATILRQRTDAVLVESAGTHSIPGLPMSTRTRTALAALDAADATHLSAQLDDAMVDRASLIAVFEPMHVSYLRKKHADGAGRVASLPRISRDLTPGPLSTFAERVDSLALASQQFEPWEEIVDPAGGELPEFEAAARAISALLDDLEPKLGR